MIRRTERAEAECLAAFDPPINLVRPRRPFGPVIFASPHSGHIYPQAFVSRTVGDLTRLRRNEDAYIDTLFSSAPQQGAPLLSARFPRCFVDVNRAEDELPSGWGACVTAQTPRAESGLGVIPTMLGEGQPIYKRTLKPSVAEKRIHALYKPYHNALRHLIAETHTMFGRVVVVDCHSMPGFSASGQRRADIILGDRYGTSCDPAVIRMIEDIFSAKGYSVKRNYPYAGSYVTSHYGRPYDNIDAIQIEINRDLYLNPVHLIPKKSYDRLARDITDIIGRIINGFAEPTALAAE